MNPGVQALPSPVDACSLFEAMRNATTAVKIFHPCRQRGDFYVPAVLNIHLRGTTRHVRTRCAATLQQTAVLCGRVSNNSCNLVTVCALAYEQHFNLLRSVLCPHPAECCTFNRVSEQHKAEKDQFRGIRRCSKKIQPPHKLKHKRLPPFNFLLCMSVAALAT